MIRLLVVFLLMTPAATAAPPAADDAERVVVTATRLPTPPRRIGHTVTVVTAADIRRRQYRSLSEALAGVPGVHVSPSGGRGMLLPSAEAESVSPVAASTALVFTSILTSYSVPFVKPVIVRSKN